MINIILGFLAGIITSFGMGGGTVLNLLLNFTKSGLKQQEIQEINMIFFVPIAVVAFFVNYKQKLIDFKISKLIIIWGIVGCIIGSKIALYIESDKLRKIFGFFLLIIAFLEVFTLIRKYILKKKENNKIYKENRREK